MKSIFRRLATGACMLLLAQMSQVFATPIPSVKVEDLLHQADLAQIVFKTYGTAPWFRAAKNLPIVSFRNLASAGLLAAPAVCPHNDGIGARVTPGMNCAS